MDRPTERNSPHWSADFVEHLRTVHFALVAVCLALVGIIQFRKPVEVTVAQSQLQEIRSAVDSWNPQAIFQNAFGRGLRPQAHYRPSPDPSEYDDLAA